MRRHLALASLLPLLVACTNRHPPPLPPAPVPGAVDGARPPSGREWPPLPAAPPAPTVDPNDPAEPGIGDLPRLARHVFRTMQAHEEICPLENPFPERLHFTVEIEVAGGRMRRVALGRVGLEPEGAGGVLPLAQARWPRELTAWADCLAPHLRAVAMAPAPSDGVYEPVYSLAGRVAP
jgi:hypothetical protein